MTEIEYLLYAKQERDLDLFIALAAKYSPSAVIRYCILHASMIGYNQLEALGFAKATRKLAKLRRDYGQNAFDTKVNQLKQQYKSLQQQRMIKPTPKPTTAPAQSQQPVQSPPLYKYGDYGWLGSYRRNEILSRYTGKMQFDKDDQTPLNIFYACYLYNKEKIGQESVPEIKRLIELIEQNDVIQDLTLGNDLVSRFFASCLLNKLSEQLEQKKYIDNLEGNENYDFDDSILEGLIDTSVIQSLDQTKKVQTFLKMFGEMAGTGSEQLYSEIIETTQLDLDSLFKVLKEISIILKKGKEQTKLKTGEITDIGLGRDLSKTIPIEFAEPDDDVFYYKYATGTLKQYEYKVKRVPESILLLIDKSGSMNDSRKMLFSRSVAMGITKKYIESSGDIFLLFFDETIFPDMPISVKNDKARFIKELLTLYNSGGTSINTALKSVSKLMDKAKPNDKFKSLNKVVIITDGSDTVSEIDYPFEIYSIFTEGFNESLKKISKKTFTINDSIEKILEI
jgi:uncharacterized protein with von Willebrand factor type A (vWA) domain